MTSILFVVVALLMWIAITANFIVKDFTFVFLLFGPYMYGCLLWCKGKLLRGLAEMAFIGWILAAGYFGELFARHLGWAVLTTSITFMHANYYSVVLNYYTIGYVPVLLLVGFLPLLAVMLIPSSHAQSAKKISSPRVIFGTSGHLLLTLLSNLQDKNARFVMRQGYMIFARIANASIRRRFKRSYTKPAGKETLGS